MSLKVHLFRASGRIFGATPDATGANLPASLAPWTSFKSLDMQRGESIPGIDVDKCLDDIARYGCHITDAHVRITPDVVVRTAAPE